VIERWQKEGWDLQKREGIWWHNAALVVTKPEELQKGLLETYHDSQMVGHPRIS